METGKLGLASVPVHISSVAAQAEKRMDIQAPLTAVYIHTVPALPAQSYPQPPAAAQKPATLHLAMPPLYSKETLPILTLHIAGGLQSQPGLSLTPAAPAAKPKSAGKHVCPHCGRDCMKPSVLEKHLRCHTGERPYPCTTCGVSFKTQSNLYKHRRTQAHARLSSESEHSSVDSMSSSRDTCTSSLSLDDRSEELGSMEKKARLPESTTPASTTKTYSVQTHGSFSEQKELSSTIHITETNGSEKVTKEEDKQMVETATSPLTVSRHLPLQRQEAMLFSKHWENSVSRGKSQSHESTDSGFSESSDHYPSPSSVLPEHSMDSLTETNKEYLEKMTSTHTSSERCHSGQEPKETVREQEQKLLEERITKLISENTAVVEDKQLENVRPRKTVLSKQGSIDLPMPYTYKDSFHFDMKINPTQSIGLQRHSKPGLYNSVPTQQSSTMERAPLTRSNSLPFSVTLLQPEKSSPTSYKSDYVTLVRRGSSGQINPTSFAMRPVSQHSSTHRPLVRQTAVDCNHATDGLFTNSSVEEACAGSLSFDGDGGDICEEPNSRKFRRKKPQKLSYKWYMYRGGTFKRFYNEKIGDSNTFKGRKCSTSPEVAQGPQKTVSVVPKKTVTTTGSTINFTKSSVVVGHPSDSLQDLNPQSSHLNSSVKAPARKNVSLSVLPLPTTGSLVSCKTECVSRTEAGRLVHFEKYTDSTSQLCEAHIPSDRKKQRTDDKITPPLETLTDPNTLTHPPPSVTGTLPPQDTNLTFVSPQNNPKHTELKGALFLPSKLTANVLSVSSPPTTSIPSAAKNSFLPKYQLKLPNAPEPDSKDSQRFVDQPKVSDDCPPTPALLSIPTDQTLLAKNFGNAIVSSLMETCATQDQLVLPCAVKTLCQSGTSKLRQSLASSLAVVHRQFAAPTKTTSCLQDYQTGLCSTLMHPFKSAANSMLLQLPGSLAPAAANGSLTTVSNQTSATIALTQSHSHLSPNPPLHHMQLSTASGSTNPGNGAHVGSNTPIVPCPIIPFDQPAKKVFHVHTADLQICLQIISDEQLALLAPQIEHPSSTVLSQRCEIEGISPEVAQKKAQSVKVGNSSEGGYNKQPGNQRKTDERKSLPTLNTERNTPPLSVQFVKGEPAPHLSEHSTTTQAAASAGSNSPHPHKYGHINRVPQPQSSAGNVMSTAASLRSINSGESQTAETETALSWSRCAEEQFFPDRRISQDGTVSQTLSGQHKLSVTSLSTRTVNQNDMKSEQLGKESQHKLQTQNQGASCNANTLISSRSPSVEYLCQANTAACVDGSVNKCKAPRQLNTHRSIYCGHQEEPTLSQSQNLSKYTKMQCNRVGPSNKFSPSLEMTSRESQDVTSSENPEKHAGQSTSLFSDIRLERLKDSPVGCTTIQGPTTGLLEGASLVECGAQKDLQTLDHARTPVQPESTDRRSKESLGEAETHHQSWEERRGGGVTGEDKNRTIKSDKVTESHCRYIVTKSEGEDTKVQVDSFKNSCLSEQHHQYFSQTQSGMSECPPPTSKEAPNTSNILDFPPSSIHTSLFNSPPLEMNQFYLSQQNWGSSIIYNPQTRVLHESNTSQRIIAQAHLSETENIFSRTELCLQQTHSFTHEHQKQTSISLSAQQENATAGNNTAVSSSDILTSGSRKNPSLSPDFVTLSSTHPSRVSQFCRTTTGLTGDIQMSQNYQNTGSPSKPFTYLKTEEKQDSIDMAPNDYTCQSSNSGRPDITSKYQSVFMAGSLSGHQPTECLISGVRPVQSCYTEDTSSSDDEGKLIIEL
ncbi:zinc finger protein 831 isoform 2-T2 [Odontesthes bonariensis]|uniref:zinc finger protein 831 n=1 Tax=Odontesthes bonariensis TaxID=219752 RepID=UPI003F581D20